MNIKEFVIELDRMPNWLVSDGVHEVHKNVNGFSSPYLMSMLNRAVANLGENELYLEVGVFQGKTLIGALVGNPTMKAIAVDNFSEFTSEDPVGILDSYLSNFNVQDQVTFLNMDFREFFSDPAFDALKGSIGVYFYDGNHDPDMGLMGLEMAVPFLADKAVIFVDDVSGMGVWESVVQFCSHHTKETALLFAIATPNFPFPNANWHNGLFAIGFSRLAPGEIRYDTLIK